MFQSLKACHSHADARILTLRSRSSPPGRVKIYPKAAEAVFRTENSTMGLGSLCLGLLGSTSGFATIVIADIAAAAATRLGVRPSVAFGAQRAHHIDGTSWFLERFITNIIVRVHLQAKGPRVGLDSSPLIPCLLKYMLPRQLLIKRLSTLRAVKLRKSSYKVTASIL